MCYIYLFPYQTLDRGDGSKGLALCVSVEVLAAGWTFRMRTRRGHACPYTREREPTRAQAAEPSWTGTKKNKTKQTKNKQTKTKQKTLELVPCRTGPRRRAVAIAVCHLQYRTGALAAATTEADARAHEGTGGGSRHTAT